MSTKNCSSCGGSIADVSPKCPLCGEWQISQSSTPPHTLGSKDSPPHRLKKEAAKTRDLLGGVKSSATWDDDNLPTEFEGDEVVEFFSLRALGQRQWTQSDFFSSSSVTHFETTFDMHSVREHSVTVPHEMKQKIYKESVKTENRARVIGFMVGFAIVGVWHANRGPLDTLGVMFPVYLLILSLTTILPGSFELPKTRIKNYKYLLIKTKAASDRGEASGSKDLRIVLAEDWDTFKRSLRPSGSS
jgi:hypothetical protein